MGEEEKPKLTEQDQKDVSGTLNFLIFYKTLT